MAEATVNPVQYNDKDDAVHPMDTDEYYEWWYFDGVFDNGYTCALSYFWRNYFTKPPVPGVLLHIYTPEGKKLLGYAGYDTKDCTASLERCDVKLGENFARQEGDHYKVRLHAHKIGAELTFKAIVPGWKGVDGCWIVYDDTGKQAWVNAIPRGSVTGTLYIDGKPVSVKGQGYHDHNWGDRHMHNSMAGWCWGRMYDDIYTFQYGWLFPVNEKQKIIPSLYVAKGSKEILRSIEVEYIEEKKELHEESGNIVPTDTTLKCKTADADISVHIKVIKTLDCSKSVGIAKFPLYYYRRLASYDAVVTYKGKTDRVTGEAINEYTYLSPVG